jgi:hypothetical protein
VFITVQQHAMQQLPLSATHGDCPAVTYWVKGMCKCCIGVWGLPKSIESIVCACVVMHIACVVIYISWHGALSIVAIRYGVGMACDI